LRLEDFTFRIEPIVECMTLAVASLSVDLIGALGDADLQVVAWGRYGLTMNRCRFVGYPR